MSHRIGYTVPFVQPSSSFLSSAMEVPNAGLVYVSGVCGVDKGKFISGTVKDRTVQSIKRIEALLQEKGLDLTDVVACTIYLANYVEDFAAFNEAYLSMFTGPIKPSRTCIGVAALAEGTDVEITATALLRTGGPKKAISSANAPPPAPFLSSAIGTDELVFVSGSCGVKDGKFIEGTVQDRTTLALKNVEALLKEEGLDLGDIVASTVYLSKYKEDFASMNKAYIAAFPAATIPMGTRTCIGVANLPAGTDVEITCTAARRGKVATPPSAAGAWASNAVLTSKAGLYFISGAVGDHVGKDAGVKAHTAAALEEIKKRLEAVGLGLNDIVSSTVYLSDFYADFKAMTEAYSPFFSGTLPTRTTIGIKDLPRGTTVEIQCVAATRKKTSKL